MNLNVYQSSILLTVSCAVCGFLHMFCRNSKVQRLLKVYCTIVATFYLAFSTALIYLKLFYMDCVDYNYFQLPLTTLSTMTLTYYRLKFVVHCDLICDIFGNIDHVDQLLRNMNIKPPHIQNAVECILFFYSTLRVSSDLCSCNDVFLYGVYLDTVIDLKIIYDPVNIVIEGSSSVIPITQCYFCLLYTSRCV